MTIRDRAGYALRERDYQDALKIKILGAHRYVISITNTIQPEDYFDGWCRRRRRVHSDLDGNPNVSELNRNDDKDWLNAWNANPDNQWNRENLFLFLAPNVSLSPALCGVSFVYV